jgi:hypothetical protein
VVSRPLTSEELLEKADLAGYARVVSVKKGRARLHFSKILKGRPTGPGFFHRFGLSRTAIVYLNPPIEEPVLGPWTDHSTYIPGTRVKTHLRWDSERQVYETVWWNAVSIVSDIEIQ